MNSKFDYTRDRIHEIFHTLFYSNDDAPNGIGNYNPGTDYPNQEDINNLINNDLLRKIQKKMGHSLSYFFIYLFMLLGFTSKMNAQSECEVHRDTLYLIALWEQQTLSYPYNVIVQPNEGYVWSKKIDNKTIDTSRYELMVKSFYSESVFCFDLYWDLQESRVANCKNNNPKEDYISMMLRFEDQMDSLNNPHYYITKSFTIYNDTFYTRESHDFDTVVATVNVSVSLCKLIVDYYVIPITSESPIPTSTVDLQYKELPYSLPYRYQLKRIVKILPLEERERIIFYGN